MCLLNPSCICALRCWAHAVQQWDALHYLQGVMSLTLTAASDPRYAEHPAVFTVHVATQIFLLLEFLGKLRVCQKLPNVANVFSVAT